MDLLDRIVFLEKEAKDFGFQWERSSQIMQQIQSECLEIKEHLGQKGALKDSVKLQEEIGDLLHAVFSLSVFCNLNPRDTLKLSLDKFEGRLHAMKAIAKEQGILHLQGFSFEELMKIWEQAKTLTD